MRITVNLKAGIMSVMLALHVGGELSDVEHANRAIVAFAATESRSDIPVDPVPERHSHHNPEEPLTNALNTEAVSRLGRQLSGMFVEVRTGHMPNSKTDSDCGLLLARLNGYKPDSSGYVCADGSATGSGTAGHVRVKNNVGIVVFRFIMTLGAGG